MWYINIWRFFWYLIYSYLTWNTISRTSSLRMRLPRWLKLCSPSSKRSTRLLVPPKLKFSNWLNSSNHILLIFSLHSNWPTLKFSRFSMKKQAEKCLLSFNNSLQPFFNKLSQETSNLINQPWLCLTFSSKCLQREYSVRYQEYE